MKGVLKKLKNMKQIAIDGDSASGKTTIGKKLAEILDFLFIDSGLFYRTATYMVIKNKMQNKKDSWYNLIYKRTISLDSDSITIDGKKIKNEFLHSEDINNLVSPVSTVSNIRKIITETLREIADNKNVVMSGRDIGTVVLKEAFIKIYLTASINTRAERRFKELIDKGVQITYNEVLENLKKRDLIDTSREDSPLSIAKDALVINTTNLNETEILGKIMLFIESKKK